MKATARAYAIQGLVKYHGLKNARLRLPFHDSISVCMKALPTVTTVSFDRDLSADRFRINGQSPSRREQERMLVVINQIRRLSSHVSAKARVESRNPDVKGKGLGFSSSGFAALGLAASSALGLHTNTRDLSEIVRLGAGSATRSLAGAFSIWYANKNGQSYAEELAQASQIKMRTIIVPVQSEVRTDSAHADAVRSPFFKPRLRYVQGALRRMRSAISRKDVESIGTLAEEDTLNLHAVTMTGRDELILLDPLSIQVIREVRRLRDEDDVPAWFSLDTGPSVFVNTTKDAAATVKRNIARIAKTVLVSDPGGPAETISKHLF